HGGGQDHRGPFPGGTRRPGLSRRYFPPGTVGFSPTAPAACCPPSGPGSRPGRTWTFLPPTACPPPKSAAARWTGCGAAARLLRGEPAAAPLFFRAAAFPAAAPDLIP